MKIKFHTTSRHSRKEKKSYRYKLFGNFQDRRIGACTIKGDLNILSEKIASPILIPCKDFPGIVRLRERVILDAILKLDSFPFNTRGHCATTDVK